MAYGFAGKRPGSDGSGVGVAQLSSAASLGGSFTDGGGGGFGHPASTITPITYARMRNDSAYLGTMRFVQASRVCIAIVLAGCGRVGFDALADATTDSTTSGDGSTVDSCNVPDLYAYWKFDERSGTQVVDQANGNDGQLLSFGAAPWVPGHFDYSLSFAGELGLPGEGVEISDNNLTNMRQFTICAWVLAHDYSAAFAAIADKSSDGTSGGWNFYLRNGPLDVGLFTNTEAFQESPGQVRDSWQHLCGTWDGGAEGTSVAIYVDGVYSIPNVVHDGGAFESDVSSTLTLGRATDGRYPFRGQLDDVRIYGRALTATEIAAVHDCVP